MVTDHRTRRVNPIRLGALALTALGAGLTTGCSYMHMPDVHLPVVPGAASDSNGPPAPSPGDDPSHVASGKGPVSVDSSVAAIAAAPGGREVLNRDLPGLLARPEYPLFKAMSLKKVASMSNGQITQEALDKTAADLAALAEPK